MQSLLDATQPKGRRYYWKSEYLSGIEPELCTGMIQHAANFPSPHSALIFFQIGGALNNLAQDYSPAGNRDAHYVLNVTGAWDKTEEDKPNIEWVRKTWEDLKKFSTGGTYINFLTEDEGSERTKIALGKALERLAEVKKKWDPDNMFCTNRNITPA